jgi:hypothetical protein
MLGEIRAPGQHLIIGARLVDAGENQPGAEDAAD